MRYVLVAIVLLLCLLVVPQSSALTMMVGENWLGGQPVQQDLTAYGGTLYREYSQSPTQDGDPQRIRLVRWPYHPVVTQASVAAMATRGLWWEMTNEANNLDQGGGLTTDSDAVAYTTWYHNSVANIRAADPTARIMGPSVLNWTRYCCEPALTTGLKAYQRFLAEHQRQYGTLPVMNALPFHYYPATSYDLVVSEGELTGQFGMAADYAQAHGWQIAVTEWGAWSEYGQGTCTSLNHTESARYHYTQHGLQTFAARGALMALYFGSVYPGCHNNGHTYYLFNADGSLTVEGRAHRDFVFGVPVVTVTPTLTSTITPTRTLTLTATLRVTVVPTSTPTPVLTATTITVTRTTIPTVTPTVSPTRCGTLLSLCTAMPTRTVCVKTFIKRCP